MGTKTELMEGLFYFGEHLRWNLGWGNPNPAGAFIATLIPWLWGIGIWLRLRGDTQALWTWTVLAGELALWFLLCKTYSRGALVAAGVAGIWLWIWNRRMVGAWKFNWLQAVRLAGISGLLLATEFFARIDPRFVTQDASAGNRIVLWKGGLQMIHVSPWTGWGAGQSGYCFTQWFQPLEAKARYLGMVNSYLHVAVERGLPVLVLALTMMVSVMVLSFFALSPKRKKTNLNMNTFQAALMTAGTSLVAWLVANIFSTLWIFGNLWWVPLGSALVVFLAGVKACGRDFLRSWWTSLRLAAVVAVIFGGSLWVAGYFLKPKVCISIDEAYVSVGAGNPSDKAVWFVPEESVLGEDWGKEIRRLAMTSAYRESKILVARSGVEMGGLPGSSPAIIIACGAKWDKGVSAKLKYPKAELILIHPVGKPELFGTLDSHVELLLPMLDTKNTGRQWRAVANTNGWVCKISPGVGQDIRVAWPNVLSPPD